MKINYKVTVEVKGHKRKRVYNRTIVVPQAIPMLCYEWFYALSHAMAKLKDDERIESISVKEVYDYE